VESETIMEFEKEWKYKLPTVLFVWKYGISKNQHKVNRWIDMYTNEDATSVTEYLHGFKYIFEVDPDKVLVKDEYYSMFGPRNCKKLEEFLFPIRNLDESAFMVKLNLDNNDPTKISNKLSIVSRKNGNNYAYYIGTNNKEDAIMMALLFK
jgi:hypothetical protein